MQMSVVNAISCCLGLWLPWEGSSALSAGAAGAFGRELGMTHRAAETDRKQRRDR